MSSTSDSATAAMGRRYRCRLELHVAAVGLAAALVLAGCGTRRPPVVPVNGEVLLAGKPVEAAFVTFLPKGGRPAAGYTDAAGRFTIRTWSEADGTIAGEHVVCVAKQVPDAKVGSSYLGVRNVLPSRYASPATSPLRATVTPEGTNEFRFDLESTPADAQSASGSSR